MPSSRSPKKKAAKKKAAKKKKTKPTRAQIGRRSRDKGGAFERKIGSELREIYDPPELVEAMAAALKAKDLKEHKRLLKASNVSRGEQTRGAKHADLLIEVCPFWLELQDANSDHYHPLGKLRQAERDVEDAGSDKWPASVCHQTGHRSIEVCLRYDALAWLATGYCFAEEGVAENMAVMVGWEDFKALLKEHQDERRA
jgi:hypothetical protein